MPDKIQEGQVWRLPDGLELHIATTPPQIIYECAGRPEVNGSQVTHEARRCRLCGGLAHKYVPLKKWVGNTTIGWSDWFGPETSLAVCAACVWVRGGKPEKPVAMGGDHFPAVCRMYSHVWDVKRGWRWYLRGQINTIRNEVLSCLQLPVGTRWFAAVSDSSKKHSVCLARLNPAGSPVAQVVLETEKATLQLSTDGRNWPLMDDVTTAYQAGLTKAGMLSGEYHTGAYMTLGHTRVRELDAPIAPYRGTTALQLAVWLAQREKTQTTTTTTEEAPNVGRDNERERKADLDGHNVGPGASLSRQQADDVGADPGGNDCRMQTDRPVRPLADSDIATPADS